MIAVALTLITLIFFLIQNRLNATDTGNEPVSYRVVNAGEGSRVNDTINQVQRSERLASAIPLETNETLLDLYSFNLDTDDEEEQILVVRRADDTEGLIRIVVADYSPQSRRWSRTWDGATLATKIKTFQITISDLLGDHDVNVICTGMNDENEQTLTVFRRIAPDEDQRLLFASIFLGSGDAVLVNSSDRADSYKLGQSNAESWSISIWRADPSAGNFLDQIKETWNWNASAGAYTPTSTERIPGASIARRIAETLLDGTTETFEQFLDGIWYKQSTDPLSDSALFVTFQPRDGAVLFSAQGIVEIYEWENSNSTRYGLYIACRNQSVRNLRRLMDVELVSTDTINLRVFQDLRIKADIAAKWDGQYRKLGPEMAKAFQVHPAKAIHTKPELDGLYTSDDGTKLRLTGSTYSLETEDILETGGFAVFEISGQAILDLRALQSGDSATSTRRSWTITTSSRNDAEGKPVSILTLSPVRIGVAGPEPMDGPNLILEKATETD
ncbi:MAG: pallilysin-related adhesin [Clostridia bacterium]